MINPNLLIKKPLIFKDEVSICIPTIKDVIGNSLFPLFKKALTISSEDLEDEFLNKDKKESLPEDFEVPSPFIHMLASCWNDKKYEGLVKQAFFFFTNEEITFLYDNKLIVFGNLEKNIERISSIDELTLLREEDFFEFQNLIREACGEKTLELDNPNEDPRIRKIKAKARYRDRIKSKKMNKDNKLSLQTSLLCLCHMNIGITPLNLGDVPYGLVDSLVALYQQKEKYELEIRELIAGGDPKKIHPVYWIKDLE